MNEKIVGWYHTGTEMKSNDKQISSIFLKYTEYPVVAKINLSPEKHKMPMETYALVQKLSSDGSVPSFNFKGVPCKIKAEESELVGIEQLLRYVKDTSVGDLSTHINKKSSSLKQFQEQIGTMSSYLEKVAEGKLPPNNEIISNIQKIWYSMPELHLLNEKEELITGATNDNFLAIYIASLVRSTLGIHSLIENKISNKEALESKNFK